jgi:hypothetical protein
MGEAYRSLMAGAEMARHLANDYRAEASETDDDYRRAVCLWEASEADDRADWYEAHAALFIKNEERKAA